MLGNNRLLRQQRFTLSLLIDGCHAELVLFPVIQAGDVTLRRSTELTDRCPLAGLFVLLLHDVVTDRLAARVLHHVFSIHLHRLTVASVRSTDYLELTACMRRCRRPDRCQCSAVA